MSPLLTHSFPLYFPPSSIAVALTLVGIFATLVVVVVGGRRSSGALLMILHHLHELLHLLLSLSFQSSLSFLWGLCLFLLPICLIHRLQRGSVLRARDSALGIENTTVTSQFPKPQSNRITLQRQKKV